MNLMFQGFFVVIGCSSLWTPGSQGQTLMSNRMKMETRRSKGRVFASVCALSGLCSPAIDRVSILRLSGDLEDAAICSLLHGVNHHEKRLHRTPTAQDSHSTELMAGCYLFSLTWNWTPSTTISFKEFEIVSHVLGTRWTRRKRRTSWLKSNIFKDNQG